MPKEAKKKTAAAAAEPKKSAKAATPADRHPVRNFLKATLLLVFIGGCVYGYLRTRDHVVQDVTFRPVPPKVVLKDRPGWMSDALVAKILRVAAPDVAHSAFDHQLLVNTASLLKNHPDTAPWVKTVKSVRRAYESGPGDVLEIDCDFRSPVALVRWELYFWLIDGDGILLPEQYTMNDLRKVMYDGNHITMRIIEGVVRPPPSSGQKWQGADLAAGIDLAKLLHGKPCADEVERVNVANVFDPANPDRTDRREAQIVLITRYQTQVRWGRPVNATDYFIEVSPAQKLEYMTRIVEQFGRVDAKHSAVDLRFDRVTYPSADTATATPEANTSAGTQDPR
jgi:hypothetical protein